jgi:hypothetical protein
MTPSSMPGLPWLSFLLRLGHIGVQKVIEQEGSMLANAQKFVVYCWNFVFNHKVSPLRHIPDVAIRHYVLQALGLMWAVAFVVATGSYTFLAASVIGHVVLIAAVAITVATWTAATLRPRLFGRSPFEQQNKGENSQDNT